MMFRKRLQCLGTMGAGNMRRIFAVLFREYKGLKRWTHQIYRIDEFQIPDTVWARGPGSKLSKWLVKTSINN